MGDLAAQDKRIGLRSQQLKSGRVMAVFEPELMLRIVEEIARGELITDIVTAAWAPTLATIMQWVMNIPEAARAFYAAREISGIMFEEKALKNAVDILGDPGSAQKVRAAGLLIDQLRWSASRRNPKLFGDTAKQTVVVPVQINTTLALGDNGASGTEEFPNIYQIDATVEAEVTAPVEEEPEKTLLPSPSRAHKLRLDPLHPQAEPAAITPPKTKSQEALERKRKADRERMAAVSAAVRDTGGNPNKMSYKEMKAWVASHKSQTPSPAQALAPEPEQGT